jgi:general secretion pathway protein I
MVALAILAAAMLAASELTSSALRNHERAVHLEVATLLARGKLAAVQDAFDRSGFRDFDQEDEGTFDREGHPEIHWKVQAVKPKIDLGAEQLLAIFMGGQPEDAKGMGLAKLVGGKAGAASSTDPQSGIETLFPGAGAMMAPMQTQLAVVGEQMKQGLREIRLTVAWKDGKHDESFTVVTHQLAFPKVITPVGP